MDKKQHAKNNREYRARKKAGIVLDRVLLTEEEKRNRKSELAKKYRAKKKERGIVGNSTDRVRKHRDKKKFQKWCEENFIYCPEHIGSSPELLGTINAAIRKQQRDRKKAPTIRKQGAELLGMLIVREPGVEYEAVGG